MAGGMGAGAGAGQGGEGVSGAAVMVVRGGGGAVVSGDGPLQECECGCEWQAQVACDNCSTQEPCSVEIYALHSPAARHAMCTRSLDMPHTLNTLANHRCKPNRHQYGTTTAAKCRHALGLMLAALSYSLSALAPLGKVEVLDGLEHLQGHAHAVLADQQHVEAVLDGGVDVVGQEAAAAGQLVDGVVRSSRLR